MQEFHEKVGHIRFALLQRAANAFLTVESDFGHSNSYDIGFQVLLNHITGFDFINTKV